MDGVQVEVGDFVGFKADTETYGRVTKIMGTELLIKVDDDDCSGGPTEHLEEADKCWKED